MVIASARKPAEKRITHKGKEGSACPLDIPLDTPFFNYLAKLSHLTPTLHVQDPRQIPPTYFAINCKQRPG